MAGYPEPCPSKRSFEELDRENRALRAQTKELERKIAECMSRRRKLAKEIAKVKRSVELLQKECEPLKGQE